MSDNRFVCLRVTSTGILSRASDGNEAESGSVGRAPRGRRADAQARRVAIGGGAPAGGVAPVGAPLGAVAGAGQRRGEPAQRSQPWASTAARCRAVRLAEQGAAGGGAASGLSHGAVDGEAGSRAHQARVRRGVQQYRVLGVAAHPGLLAAEAGKAGVAARRAGHQHLEAQGVACAKKSPNARDEP